MKEILNMNDKEYAKQCFDKALQIGFDFKLNNDVKEKNFDFNSMKDVLDTPVSGMELNSLLDYFKEDVAPYCTNFANPNFMGFPDAGNSVAGISGAIISDFM